MNSEATPVSPQNAGTRTDADRPVVAKSSRPRVLLLAPFLSVLFASSSLSWAAQFVLFDVTFTFTKEDADNSQPSKSHYYVKGAALNAERPRDWTAPVDYRNGTVHLRTEILAKPAGGEPTTWSICYIPNRGQGNGYGCTGTDVYREKGVYEKDVSMKTFWQNEGIVWTEGIKQMDLVMKDNSGGSGHVHKRTDPEKFFPTRLRITAVQVSAGAVYDPSLVPNLPRRPAVDAGKPKGRDLLSLVREAFRKVLEPLAQTGDGLWQTREPVEKTGERHGNTGDVVGKSAGATWESPEGTCASRGAAQENAGGVLDRAGGTRASLGGGWEFAGASQASQGSLRENAGMK